MIMLIRRLAPNALIRVDGVTIGADPVELRHGTRIDIGNCQLTPTGPWSMGIESREREVPPGGVLKLGNVKLTSRPRIAKNGAGTKTHQVSRGELFRRLVKLWEKGSSRSGK